MLPVPSTPYTPSIQISGFDTINTHTAFTRIHSARYTGGTENTWSIISRIFRIVSTGSILSTSYVCPPKVIYSKPRSWGRIYIYMCVCFLMKPLYAILRVYYCQYSFFPKVLFFTRIPRYWEYLVQHIIHTQEVCPWGFSATWLRPASMSLESSYSTGNYRRNDSRSRRAAAWVAVVKAG